NAPSPDITQHKRMEEALQESEQKYRTLFENLNDAVFLADAETGYIDTNKQGEVMLGRTRAEVIGMHQRELHPPGAANEYRQRFATHVQKGRVADYDGAVIRKDGSIVPVSISATPVTIGGKQLILGLFRDITERKQAEKALKSSEERLKILFEFAPDAYYLSDLKGNFVDGNKAAEKITGYKREELIGKNFLKLKLLSPRQILKAAALLARNALGKATGPDEFTFIRKDGSHVLLEIRTFPVKIESKTMVLGIARDITERKQAEKDIRIKDSAIASSINAIAMADLDGNVTYVNPAFLKMWGYDDEKEILGKSAVTFWQTAEQAMEVMRAAMDRGGLIGELAAKRKDGSLFDVQLSASVVRDEAGKPIYRLGSFVDITERKRLEQEIQNKSEQLEAQNEELRALNEELQAANEELRETEEQLIRSERLAAIGQLAGGVGHELRNPLGAIKNAVYYIRGKVAKSELAQQEPRVMEFLDIMDDEINSSNKIISDLLGFSRVGKPSVSSVKIERVIEDALARTPITENIEVIKKFDEDLPEVNIDASQIRQVLINIITNAVQAMPEGGKLTISAREKKEFLDVGIADTGCGIPQEVIGKIFNPLFTTRAKGIGLGLAVCKTIIESHEGSITVNSKEGKGTTFNIKLLLKRE
ncbi:MAG: PAS domain S-box protein, partial [Dehalococcoidales bacterium]|nr:PAS domain S-box protein [Dehalococcoidales bacterium]